MANSVYHINKGINKSVEFKGLKAQYIWYLGACVVALLVVFAIMYIIGINQYICMLVIFGTGFLLVLKIYKMSHTYGEHGLMKVMAKRQVPGLIKSNSRRIFVRLNRKKNGNSK
jgi:uncharacterized membrane protein (DUF4010 family)